MNLRSLPPGARRTFGHHLAYSALSGLTSGILVNGPVIGIKRLMAADWHLALPTGLTGFGLLLALVLGVWMARRPKMPFVLVPGLLACLACLGMVVTTDPLWFLTLLGLSNLFEVVTRPAITAIIRANYPAESRGWVTGKLRKWSAATFLLAAFATARLLDRGASLAWTRAVLGAAAGLQLLAYACFARIRVVPDAGDAPDEPAAGVLAVVRSRTRLLRHDARFARYLAGCFVHGVGALTYEPIVRAYFSTDLGLNYTECVVLADVLPSVLSVLTVQRLGSWLDRTNPLVAWAVIRLAWGLDPLILALASIWPGRALAIAVVARLFRGSVMNASWVLGWQLGTNYFAPRRELTSVYMGMFLFVTGVQRLCGPSLGVLISAWASRSGVLVVGGLLVVTGAYLAWRQAESERTDGRYPTFAEKEREGLMAAVPAAD